jgi:Pyruvate/2-oxoacid:ferredoxin oxidoreductase gamma subunit
MLGAFIRATKLISLESVLKAVGDYFKGKLAEKNMAAVKAAHERTVVQPLK